MMTAIQDASRRFVSDPPVSATLSAFFVFYLSSYLLMHYVPIFLPVAFHSVLLIVGVLLVLWLAAPRVRAYKYLNPAQPDWILLISSAFLFLLSSLVINGAYSSLTTFRAFVLGFFCFFFVRIAGTYTPHSLLIRIFSLYLISSGILTMLQVFIGPEFYLGGYIGTYYGRGFASETDMGGVLMLWPLAVLMTDLVGRSVAQRESWMRWAGLVCGVVGIYFTLSRAAWVALVIVSVLLLARAWASPSRKRSALIVAVAVTAFIVANVVPSGVDRYEGIKIKGELSSWQAPVAEKAVGQKAVDDAIARLGMLAPVSPSFSVNTRLFSLYVARQVLAEHSVFWGIGLGQFPSYYEVYYKKLPLALQARLDASSKVAAHNSLAQYIVEVGALPAMLLLVLVGWTLRGGLTSDVTNPAFAYAVGLAGVLTFMLFNDLFGDRLFWIALGLSVAFLRPLSDKAPAWRMAH